MIQHNVDGAPKAIGPYCHAVETGNLLFCSGQTPLDPETMEVVGESVTEQTERVLANISIVLGGFGLKLDSIVKTTVFLRDMSYFKEMNAAYARAFGDHKPARSTIAVRENPMNVMVEIECIAELR